MPLKMMKFYSDLVDEQVERNADNSVSAAEYERLVTAVKLYRSTITNAVEGIIQTTTDGKFLNVNPAFAKMLGYQSPQELIDDIESIDAQVYVSAEVRREFLENIDRDGKAKCEYQAWKKNGSTTWLLASSRVVKDATGKFLYYESIVEDISDRKEKQAQLEKLAASLSRSNAELKRFASTVAHDISSPINTVQSFCELLQLTCSDKLDAKEKEYFEMIIGGTKRIRAIISDILEFSMIESSGLKEEDIDLNLLINEVLHDLSTAIARERAQVVCSHLPTVKGDRPKMLRLFQNLIGNSLKFRKQEELMISISAFDDEGEWIFRVRDNGMGFDPKHQERIFEMFSRLTSPKQHAGLGMGLALCRRIIEAHGGRIWAESHPGSGTSIFFSLSKA